MTQKIGLALGGGGARGLAHIGVVKVLEREKIPIDVVAGTSMGGVIGAAFASDLSLEKLESVARGFRSYARQIRLMDFDLTGVGLIKGTRVYRLLASMMGEDLTFAELRIPTAMVSIDLNTGRQVVLWEGKVVDAIRATISVPGVFRPVERDEMLLADGGVLDNLPVDVARNLGAKSVIAVDVLPRFHPNQPGKPPVVHPLKTPFVTQSVQDLLHTFMIMVSELTEFRLQQAPADVVIRPALPTDVHLFTGFERSEEIIAAGIAATEEALPQIRALLEQE